MSNGKLSEASVYLAVPGKPGSHATFSDFVHASTALRNSLRHIERCVSGRSKPFELAVSDLRISSAAISVSPEDIESSDIPIWEDVASVLFDTCRRLEKGDKSLDPRLDYAALAALDDFSPTLRRGRSELSVSGVLLSNTFVNTLHDVMEPIQPTKGSVSGIVEQLDVHGKCTFSLFPANESDDIKCLFHIRDFEQVRSAVRRHVTVFGTLHYGVGRPFPIKAKMDKLEIHPADSELPTLASMAGILRGHLKHDSVKTIRAIRDEWK